MRDFETLHRYLAARTAQPFAWGREANDCVSFALGAVEVLTGRAIRGQLPSWTTERGALRALARLGGLAAAVDTVLTPIAPAMAQRGDVAMAENPQTGAQALFVVEGATLVGPDASGARRLPRARMAKAWSAA